MIIQQADGRRQVGYYPTPEAYGLARASMTEPGRGYGALCIVDPLTCGKPGQGRWVAFEVWFPRIGSGVHPDRATAFLRGERPWPW